MRRAWLLLIAALVLIPACGKDTNPESDPADPPPTGIALPARPYDVRIDGIDPCSLLTPEQRAELGLDGPVRGWLDENSPLYGGGVPSCVLRGFTPRAITVGLGVVTTSGIEVFTSGRSNSDIFPLSVKGFPAVRAVPHRFSEYCTVAVDVAPSQLLEVQVSDGGRLPPVSQEELCRDAERVGLSAMASLLAS